MGIWTRTLGNKAESPAAACATLINGSNLYSLRGDLPDALAHARKPSTNSLFAYTSATKTEQTLTSACKAGTIHGYGRQKCEFAILLQYSSAEQGQPTAAAAAAGCQEVSDQSDMAHSSAQTAIVVHSG